MMQYKKWYDKWSIALSGEIRRLLLCIRPVDFLLVEVDGQTVGPAQVSGDDHLSLVAGHSGALDLRHPPPVRPENEPGEEWS